MSLQNVSSCLKLIVYSLSSVKHNVLLIIIKTVMVRLVEKTNTKVHDNTDFSLTKYQSFLVDSILNIFQC